MPEERISEERENKSYPVLGTLAYLLVPGERRKKAAGHFRRAGFEAIKGVGTLARPRKSGDESPENEKNTRQSINID